MDESTEALLGRVAELETVTAGVVDVVNTAVTAVENAVRELTENAADEAAVRAAAEKLGAFATALSGAREKLANAVISGTPAEDPEDAEDPIEVPEPQPEGGNGDQA